MTGGAPILANLKAAQLMLPEPLRYSVFIDLQALGNIGRRKQGLFAHSPVPYKTRSQLQYMIAPIKGESTQGPIKQL